MIRKHFSKEWVVIKKRQHLDLSRLKGGAPHAYLPKRVDSLSCRCSCITSYAQAQDLSAQLLHAQYVAFGYETAQGFVSDSSMEALTSPTIAPQDREALSNVRKAMEKWKRYIAVVRPSEADMLVAIRAVHQGSVYVGGRIGHVPTGSVPGSASGPVVGGELGPSKDYLGIYEAENGREGVQLWSQTQEDGLAGKNPPLFQSFKDDVESLAKKQSKP